MSQPVWSLGTLRLGPRSPATLGILAGLSLSLALFAAVRTAHQARIRADFDSDAAARAAVVQKRLARVEGILQSIGAVGAPSPAAGPLSVGRFHHEGLRGGTWIPAGACAGEESGFDTSDPARRAALGKACQTGRAATALLRHADGVARLEVIVPVSRADAGSAVGPDPQETPAGFLAVELDLASLLRAPRGPHTPDLSLEARELTAGTVSGDLVWSATAELADHGWLLSVRPEPAYLAQRRGWAAWAILAAGLAATAGLGYWLSSRSRQAAQTERQEVAAEVEEVKHALDAILVVDESGHIVRANPAARHALGYSEEALAGKHFSFLFPEGPEPTREELLDDLRIYGAALQEQWFRRADGALVPMDLTAAIVPSGDGHSIIVTLRDVSERREARRAEGEREERERRAQKLEAVGRLAGGVAHDFNNLLAVVTGYAEILLRRMAPDDPLRKPADEIRKASERAAGLTRRLLSFGGGQIVQPRMADLNRVIADMEGGLRRLAGEKVELRLPAGAEALWVRVDVGQLEQVILSLATNAREAMPGEGRLSLETARVAHEGTRGTPPGDYVCLAVSDTGTGIAPELRERVFEPFFTTKEKAKGAGLGLATSYGIVRKWGGQILFESELGRGTTFRVLLPRVEAPSAPDERPQTPKRASETVLLVEDESELRALAREILEAEGYVVLEAGDGDAAARFCGQPAPVHLLLTDVSMPGLNGRELALRLVGMRPELRVLFMSGYTDDRELREAVKAGAAFLAKPFPPEALVRKVREVLDAP